MTSRIRLGLIVWCALSNRYTRASTISTSTTRISSSEALATTIGPTSTAPTSASSALGATSIPSPASCLPNFIAPIAVPIHNVTLQGPQGNIIRRGAELSIGTPPQPLAFIISDQTNNTAIFDTYNQCYTDAGANYTKPNSTAAGCFSFYGGAFNESRSSTWTSSSSFAALGVPKDSITWFGPISYGSDTVTLTSNISTSKSPLLIDYGRTGYEAFFMNSIGLGINSTLLNTLVSTGKIASRTWSMFNGFTGSQSHNQSDGILVLGGYDEAKISGNTAENITIDFNFASDTNDIADCPATGMIITVNNMTLVWPNGTQAGLMGSSRSSQMGACVIPNYDYISVTNDMWQTFVSVTNSEEAGRSNSPLSWFQNLVTADSAFTGDLVISIDPGLDITIPNHELVRSFVDINATTGQEYISDSSKRVMGMYAEDSQTADTIIALGRTFLTGAYLMVDADKQKFTLWKGQSSTEQKLIANGPSLCPEAAHTASPTAISQKNSAPAMSKGAIAGVSVALISVIAIAIGAVYFLVQKRKNAKAMRDDNDEQRGKHASPESEESIFQKPELPSDHHQQPPQEMAPGENSVSAIPPYEMNGVDTFPTEMAAQEKSVEMAANENSATEKPGDDIEPVSPIELPSTPRSKASVKRLLTMSRSANQSFKSPKTPKRKSLPDHLDIPKKSPADGAVSPL